MEVILDGIGRLTTEHSASSYGQPVLLPEDGEGAVGPGDLTEFEGELRPWAYMVRCWLWFNRNRLTSAEREFAEGFAGMPVGG